MATRKILRSGRGVLAANVHVGGVWYGPSHPEAGDPPNPDALPDHVWDVRKCWPTREDAERVGLAWDGPAPVAEPVGDETVKSGQKET